MDLISGLQSLLGGEPPSARQKGEQRSGTSSRQGSELRKKSSHMKEQLNAARERIAQLESQIDKLKEESTKVEQHLDTQREDIDQLITGVSVQIQEMIDSLNLKMEEIDFKTQRQISELQGTTDQIQDIAESTKQIDEIKAMIENLEQQKTSLDEINEKSEDIKQELFEKIHTENVACYRNMKSLVTELHEDVNDMEISEDSLLRIRKSFKGLKFFSIFSLLSFAVALFILLYILGVIRF